MNKYIILFKNNNSAEYEFVKSGGGTTKNILEAKKYSQISIEEFEITIITSTSQLNTELSRTNGVQKYAILVDNLFNILNEPIVVIPKGVYRDNNKCSVDMDMIVSVLEPIAKKLNIEIVIRGNDKEDLSIGSLF